MNNKKIIKLTIFVMVILIILKLSLLQKEALLNRQKAISPDEMRTARIAIKEVMGNLTSFHQFIEFDINQQELSALSKLGSPTRRRCARCTSGSPTLPHMAALLDARAAATASSRNLTAHRTAESVERGWSECYPRLTPASDE